MPLPTQWSKTPFTIHNKSLLVLGVMMFCLQMIILPSWRLFVATPKVWSLAGLAVMTMVVLLLLWVAISIQLRWAFRQISLGTALRTEVGAGMILAWGIFLWPAFCDRQLQMSQASMESTTGQADTVLKLLTSVLEAQQQFQQARRQDSNGDGEYGSLEELRTAGLLPPALQAVPGEATFTNGGYVFMIYVSDAVKAAPNQWCIYAWPLQYRVTGNLSYFMHETGAVYVSEDGRFQGVRQVDGPADFEAYFPGVPAGQVPNPTTMKAFQATIANPRWQPAAPASSGAPNFR